MLTELMVTDLGVVSELAVVFGPGMTVLTGETGAGKTLVVGAIDLLVGGRADSDMVRAGADEAVIEGRFEIPDEPGQELVLSRVVPAAGRSRAYVNGRLKSSWPTDYGDLGSDDDWGLPDGTRIGLGTYESRAEFTRVALLEVGGRGRPVR